MADKSKIEWLDGGSTWNPIRARNRITGKLGWFCTKPSPGCKGCYAERMNVGLFGNGVRYAVDQQHLVEIFLDEKTLLAPLHWKKPRLIFPCSMTDWQADFVPDEFRDKMMAVMALTPQHTYLTLTKRAGNQQKYFTDLDELDMQIGAAAGTFLDGEWIWGAGKKYRKQIEDLISQAHGFEGDDETQSANGLLPLRNLWLGVSAENQKYADERIPLLLQTPAAVRWVSAEPLLGPIQMRGHLGLIAATYGARKLDWAVVGYESGPLARPGHPDWARSLRDQCQVAGVPFFFKQWGEWGGCDAKKEFNCTGERHVYEVHKFADDIHVVKRGKKANGRLLDGVEHSEYPKVTAAAEARPHAVGSTGNNAG